MDLPLLIFYGLAAVGLTAAILMATRRNLVHAALYLIVVFFVVAAMFVLLQAEFLAAVQVLVYAGGIMVLYLFVILLVDVHAEASIRPKRRSIHTWSALALTIATLALLGVNIVAGPSPVADAGVAQASAGGNLEAVALALFRNYLLPFEAVSILLLVAMVGAIILAKADEEGSRTIE